MAPELILVRLEVPVKEKNLVTIHVLGHGLKI
jgi:hypothetical protein